MNEPSKAAFSFDGFAIVHFLLNEPTNFDSEISIAINPKGKYNPQNGEFEETIEFFALDSEDNSKVIVKVELRATFTFESPIEFKDIPDYFYLNSIAIVFPYIRAFVSSLTLQANLKPLILPVLNLTGLDKPLRENTVCVD